MNNNTRTPRTPDVKPLRMHETIGYIDSSPKRKFMIGWDCTPDSGIRTRNWIEGALVIFSLLGACLNAFGSVWGFAIWLPVNIVYGFVNSRKSRGWLSALFYAYALTSIWGLVRYFYF